WRALRGRRIAVARGAVRRAAAALGRAADRARPVPVVLRIADAAHRARAAGPRVGALRSTRTDARAGATRARALVVVAPLAARAARSSRASSRARVPRAARSA